MKNKPLTPTECFIRDTCVEMTKKSVSCLKVCTDNKSMFTRPLDENARNRTERVAAVADMIGPLVAKFSGALTNLLRILLQTFQHGRELLLCGFVSWPGPFNRIVFYPTAFWPRHGNAITIALPAEPWHCCGLAGLHAETIRQVLHLVRWPWTRNSIYRTQVPSIVWFGRHHNPIKQIRGRACVFVISFDTIETTPGSSWSLQQRLTGSVASAHQKNNFYTKFPRRTLRPKSSTIT